MNRFKKNIRSLCFGLGLSLLFIIALLISAGHQGVGEKVVIFAVSLFVLGTLVYIIELK